MATFTEHKKAIYLVIGYNGNINQRECDEDELQNGLPESYVAGPYPTNRASWKDCKLLNYLLAEEDKRHFIFALLMINGVLSDGS